MQTRLPISGRPRLPAIARGWLPAFICLMAAWPTLGFAASISISGPQIMIDNRRFIMHGVCYAPTPIGLAGNQSPYGDFFTTTYRDIYDRDLPLMRQMGVNCVRLYGWSTTDDHTEFLDHAFNRGQQPVYVIINRWVDPNTAWSSPAAVNAIKAEWQAIALSARNHPALLGYAIGNELNFANGGNPAFWAAMNDIAGAIRSVDPAHLITTPLGDGNLLSQIQTRDAVMTNLNCWAVQMYRGSNFNGFFPDYAAASSKPLLVLEFGLDAFDANSSHEYANNAATPATYIANLWNDMLAHSNVVSGGAVFCWTDEWWKQGSPFSPNAGGWTNPAFPDGQADEEWWGLYRISPGNPNVLDPRAAAGLLKTLWFTPPAPAGLSSPTLTPNGQFQTTVTGTPGYGYAVWSSMDLQLWTPRQTNLPPFDFTETNVPPPSRQFYRASPLP